MPAARLANAACGISHAVAPIDVRAGCMIDLLMRFTEKERRKPVRCVNSKTF